MKADRTTKHGVTVEIWNSGFLQKALEEMKPRVERSISEALRKALRTDR